MNTAEHHFQKASNAEKCSAVVFYLVFITSAALVAVPTHAVEQIGYPCLMGEVVLAVICTIITTICQNEGNRALRETQLADALGAASGEPIRENYYNNVLPKSLERLAASTLENALFTKEILSRMLVRMRIKTGAYFVLLLVLAGCRGTPASWLVTLAQTLFSTDLVLKHIRMERFRLRTSRVYSHLAQFFMQAGRTDKPNDTAILLAAFTDYECAKDEAALPLDDKIFKRLNPELSKKWDEMQNRLNLKGPTLQ